MAWLTWRSMSTSNPVSCPVVGSRYPHRYVPSSTPTLR